MRWQSGVIGLHVVSDIAIALAYFSIPIVLVLFLRKRRDIRFSWLFAAFALFILACGATHVMDVVTLWNPLYRLAGVFKAITALVSVGTAIALIRLWPSLLRLPTTDQLQAANRALELELQQRRATEAKLAQVNSELAIQANHNLQRFRTTFENAAIGLAHVSPDGKFLLANKYLCKMLGYSPAEMLSLGIADITHPEDLNDSWSGATALLAGPGEAYCVQNRYVHKNGLLIWSTLQVSLVRTPDGEPAYFIAAIQDTTRQKETEESLRQAGLVLRQRDQQIEHAFERAGLGDWTWDMHRDEVFVHPVVFAIYGYPDLRGSLPSAWFFDRIHPDDREYVAASLQKALEERSRFDLEYRIVRPDNSIHWIGCRGSALWDDDGKPIGTQGINLDITARKEAELALRDSQAQLSLLAEVAPQMLWFTAANGDVEFFNEGWYRYTGQTPNNSLNWGWQPVLHPDDLERTLEVWRHSLASGNTYEREFRLKGADGKYRWHLGRALPHRNEAGQIIRWFGSCTDIHEIKMAEANLRSFQEALEKQVAERTAALLAASEATLQARTRLQIVLDSARQVAIIIVNNDGIIEHFNRGAEELLRCSAQDVIGRTPAIFFPPEELARRQADISQLMGRPVAADDLHKSGNQPSYAYSLETTYRRCDGTEMQASISIAPIFDSYGRKAGILGIFIDISEQKKLQEQLQHSNAQLVAQTQQAVKVNRAKSQFLASMSHEIRTPMNAILGIAELLGETDLDARQRRFVEVFQKSGDFLLTLIDDILDLSKIESGHLELEKVHFDLEELVDRTIELIRPKAEARQIGLSARISTPMPNAFLGDPNRLQQIFLNLLGNAIKFTEQGSVSLEISSAGPAGPIHFEVQDTGVGIPADKLETIFEDFKQAECSTTRRFGGTGLGLGIARSLVERMGGVLKVRSELCKGSTFYFDVMLEPDKQAPVTDEEGTIALVGARVLIIDHNSTNRLIFSELCRTWGMEVTQCSRARRALELLNKNGTASFDIALLDDRMPDMDGFRFLSMLRDQGSSIPIVMVTSDTVRGDESKARRLGVSGYGVKPLKQSELKRLLRNALTGENIAERPSGTDAPEQSLRPKPSLRILIAEDFEDNRFLFEAYLKDTTYSVTFVENGEQAVAAIRKENFDLVLMDIQMPAMDGLTATRLVRQEEEAHNRKQIPILALTANAMLEDIEASRSAGCTGHLGKPISKHKLLTVLAEYTTAAALEPA